jgi:hypothetical protein
MYCTGFDPCEPPVFIENASQRPELQFAEAAHNSTRVVLSLVVVDVNRVFAHVCDVGECPMDEFGIDCLEGSLLPFIVTVSSWMLFFWRNSRFIAEYSSGQRNRIERSPSCSRELKSWKFG